MTIGSNSSSYAQPVTIDQGILTTLDGATADRPLGTGSTITVNPGGILRLAASQNVTGSTLTVNSDAANLGVLGLAYNGAPPHRRLREQRWAE